MSLDSRHPRYHSLAVREKLAKGVVMGITSFSGLIAHGRGEAFDYLLGEKTHPFAKKACEMAAQVLLESKRPVISINGNTAILVPKETAQLADILACPIEINLFHYSAKRAKKIESFLKKFSKRVLSTKSKTVILPRVASNRKITIRDGIFQSDCVLVPLEDGDRANALISMHKKVITVDLNPLSRTAQVATITIVDNILRAFPLLVQTIIKLKSAHEDTRRNNVKKFSNQRLLFEAYQTIVKGIDR